MTRTNGWTNKQKALAVRACKSIGLGDDQRKLILRQLGGHALINDQPTSTSPRLTQADFEKFMAYVESYASDSRLMSKPAYYWQDQYDNGPQGRLLYKARQLSNALTDAGVAWVGIVNKAIGREFDALLANLDEDELGKAIDAMTAVGKRGAA